VCYALEFLFYVKSALDAHKDNRGLVLANPDEFVQDMTDEIRFKRVIYLRIHVAGDFFSVAYIQMWIKIARTCPRVKFYFYTRSWRVPELLPPLLELARLGNVFAWWSENRNSGPRGPALLPVRRRG
jgi:hypothetical protein